MAKFFYIDFGSETGKIMLKCICRKQKQIFNLKYLVQIKQNSRPKKSISTYQICDIFQLIFCIYCVHLQSAQCMHVTDYLIG